jgi:ComF family protein
MTTAELGKKGNLCGNCVRQLPFKKVFVVGERKKALRRLVGNYKYFSRRASAAALAQLLDGTLPTILPDDMTIIPLPTIPKHIRERGFDHTKLVVKDLARRRGMMADLRLLRRADNTSQHSAGQQLRRAQAARAFRLDLQRPVPRRVLLIDDIYTTGETTMAAARLLKKHGAKEVWLGVVARQTDKMLQ